MIVEMHKFSDLAKIFCFHLLGYCRAAFDSENSDKK